MNSHRRFRPRDDGNLADADGFAGGGARAGRGVADGDVRAEVIRPHLDLLAVKQDHEGASAGLGGVVTADVHVVFLVVVNARDFSLPVFLPERNEPRLDDGGDLARMLREVGLVLRRDVLAAARSVPAAVEELHPKPRQHPGLGLGHAVAGHHRGFHAGGGRGYVHRLRLPNRLVRSVLRVEVHRERVLASLGGHVLAVEVVGGGTGAGRVRQPGQREHVGPHGIDVHGDAESVPRENVVVDPVAVSVLGVDHDLDLVADVSVARLGVTEPFDNRRGGGTGVDHDVDQARVHHAGCGHHWPDPSGHARLKVGVVLLRADQGLEQPRASLGLRQAHAVAPVAVVEDGGVAGGTRAERLFIQLDLHEPARGGSHDTRVHAVPLVVGARREPRARVRDQLNRVPRLLTGVGSRQSRPGGSRQQRVDVHVQRIDQDVHRLGRSRNVDAVEFDADGHVARGLTGPAGDQVADAVGRGLRRDLRAVRRGDAQRIPRRVTRAQRRVVTAAIARGDDHGKFNPRGGSVFGAKARHGAGYHETSHGASRVRGFRHVVMFAVPERAAVVGVLALDDVLNVDECQDKPDLTDRVVDQVGAVRVVVGGVEDGTGTSQGAVAGEVRAVGNKLDGGLLGSHDGRGGVENLAHPHVQFYADFVPLAVLNLVVVLVIRLATSADWHEQRPVVHDVVAEPVANLHPEVVRLGDNRGLGDARAPHREVARRQRRRLDNDGQRHLVFAHDLPVHRDPQLVRPGFDRGEGQVVESVEHVGHPHGDLLSAVLIDVPLGGVQSRGDRDLRGGVRVVVGVVPVDIPRPNHQLMSLAGDEGVIAHAAGIVAHHPRVCVENNRAFRRRARRRHDQLERRTLDVSAVQGHVQLVRIDGSVDLVRDAIGAPLHLVPASRLVREDDLVRDGFTRGGSVRLRKRPEGVARRGYDDVERVGDGLVAQVLRNAVLVHRFDDEDVVFAGDAADGVRDSARRFAAQLGFFIQTAGCGVFDGVRERRGRARAGRRQVERRVLDVRGADHHR